MSRWATIKRRRCSMTLDHSRRSAWESMPASGSCRFGRMPLDSSRHNCRRHDWPLRLRTPGPCRSSSSRPSCVSVARTQIGNKGSATWEGYKVHLTETCATDEVHLLTHVDTTEAPVADADRAEPIQDALVAKGLPPGEHLLDAGYVDADLVLTSQSRQGIEVVGPVRPDSSWQARSPDRYDLSRFTIDWAAQTVTCPEGRTNTCWTPHPDAWNNAVISVKFSRTDCRLCPTRARCTRAATGAPRHLTLRPHADHEALQHLRQHQQTEAWHQRYRRRAGIEGTLSQASLTFTPTDWNVPQNVVVTGVNDGTSGDARMSATTSSSP